MNTYRGLKHAMLVALLCLASTTFGEAVIWSSGVITLPDGSTAGEGDVTMYALINWNISNWGELTRSDIYGEINNGMTADNIMSFHRNTDAVLITTQSDSTGQASVDNGIDRGFANERAVVLFVCEYDGHEWYKQVDGEFHSTAAIPIYTNTDMALRGEWVMGRDLGAVPEPTSAVLSLLGFCVLVLRRRFAM